MQLIPIDAETPATDNAVWIDEEPFSYLEDCILKSCPGYANYGHWGVTTIPMSVWHDIATLLRDLRQSLLLADHPNAVVGLFFMFAHSPTRFSRTFPRVRPALAALINDLLTWLDLHYVSCSAISSHGI